MVFFSVIRYTDDDDKEDTSDKAQEILKKLHEAAEKRRKSKQLEVISDESVAKICKSESSDQDSHNERHHKSELSTDIQKDDQEHSLQPASDVEYQHVSGETSEKGKISKRKKTHKKTEKNVDTSGTTAVKGEQKARKRKRQRSEIITDLTKEDKQLEDSDIIGGEESRIDTKESPEDQKDDPTLKDFNDVEESTEKDNEEQGMDVDNSAYTILGEVKEKTLPKVHRVLPNWLDKPTVIEDDLKHKRTAFDKVPGLDPSLLDKLRENGISDFFPVQGVVIPELLQSFQFGFLYGEAGFRPSDICCSAPTGSGKTLAYVLPIIQGLSGRIVPQIRALVVLPVRDLVKQVYSVFQTYCQGTNLKVLQLTGFKTFSNEQALLVKKGPCGFESQCDILVSTPGRLVDHINRTPGFTLQHLRFLVIDEADRMMDEIKQDWLRYVEDAVYSNANKGNENSVSQWDSVVKKTNSVYGSIRRLPYGPMTPLSACRPQLVLQKLLFSATLSQNPEKLQRLNLFQPKLFTAVVQDVSKEFRKTEGEFIGKFTTPVGLTEFYVESDTAQKPLVMIRFLEHLKFRHVLCFTNLAETAHRLYWLIKLTCNVQVREISPRLKDRRRNKILRKFADGKIDVLVCTDAMARGMDIDNIRFVISYDKPIYLKTYIHRAGRTARAGKVGTAITLLEKKEIFHFKKMLKEAGKTQFKEMSIKTTDLEPFVPAYTKALAHLQRIIESESQK